jgi:ribonuclease VapC
VVVDTSALLAILFAEPEADAMVLSLARDPRRLIGAPTLLEASAVMRARKGGAGEVALDALLERLEVEAVPMGVAAARFARLASARFGRGIGDPPVLNYGDCLAYGVAMAEREPLLFKGNDFGKTDVQVAAY